MSKQITAKEAAALVADRATLAISGFGAYGACDELLGALEARHKEEGHPCDLTAVTGICGGNFTDDDIAMNRLIAPGLVKTLIAAHIGNAPLMSKKIANNEIEGFMLPLGVVMHLYRAIAGKKPGVLTHIGLGTFVDPKNEGGKVNDKAKASGREIVERLKVGEEECLLYKSFPIDVCFIRGTYADEDGNLSTSDEAITDAQLEIAAATHNSGGIVIAQVKEIVKKGSIHAKDVRVHHSLIDYVVKANPENHRQGYAVPYDRPELTGDIRVPTGAIEAMPMSIRKVIARRGAMELTKGAVMNLGIGIPAGVGSVANEEGVADSAILSLESGPIGGVPVEGVGFAGSVNADCIYGICDTFDLYDGGVLDMTFLGAAEIDVKGNVNVSKFGTRCTGPGGFINISQNARKLCYMGAFTSGKSEIEIKDGKLNIVREGGGIKFVNEVQQITFSSDYALKIKQEVMYITERAVFRLTEEGLTLTEIAPGVDLEKDILQYMEFKPVIAKDLKEMDARLFTDELMGL